MCRITDQYRNGLPLQVVDPQHIDAVVYRPFGVAPNQNTAIIVFFLPINCRLGFAPPRRTTSRLPPSIGQRRRIAQLGDQMNDIGFLCFAFLRRATDIVRTT